MTTIFSSPVPDASGSRRGLVSSGSQLFNGPKTFGSALTISKPPVTNESALVLPTPVNPGTYGNAGAITWNTSNSFIRNSTTDFLIYGYNVPTSVWAAFNTAQLVGGVGGASDVVTKIGSYLDDSATNSATKLLSIRTGLTGSGIEHAYFTKGGAFTPKFVIDTKSATNAPAISIINNGAGDSGINFEGSYSSGGADITLGSVSTRGLYTRTTNRTQSWLVNSDAYSTSARALLDWEVSGITATSVSKDISRFTAPAAHSGNLARWVYGTTDSAIITSSGTFKTLTGSAANTALGPIGDDNTGIWYPAADTINMVTGGSLRLQIGATGVTTFGGGVTIPTSTLLSIGTGVTIYESPTGQANFTGNIALSGTLTHRTSATNDVLMRSYPTTGTGKNRIFDMYDSSDPSNSGYLMVGITPTAGWATNTSGSFILSGKNGTGTLQNLFVCAADDFPYPDVTKGLMIHASNGYVGIGKTDPTTRLDVNGQTTTAGLVSSETVTITGGRSLFTSGVYARGGTITNDTGALNVSAAAAGSLSLFSALGAGASDVTVKIGTSVADASVNASAKLLSVRTGIGGTEVEKAWFTGTGGLMIKGSPSTSANITGTQAAALGSYNANIQAAALWLNQDTPSVSNYVIGATTSGGLGMVTGTNINAPAGSQSAFIFGGNGTAMAAVVSSGRLDQSGTDSSGTPGAATINKPTGISSIAAGASSVIITNSLVTATSRVLITWLGDNGAARSWVTRSAGAFTVNLSANATANTPFAWEVSSIL